MHRVMGWAIACSVVSLVPVFGAQTWSIPFSENTQDLIQAARAVTRSDRPEVVVFINEQNYNVRRDGRVEATIRQVYRVDQQEAVDDWSTVEQLYQPWYQEKPELRARVITADGAIRWLDAKTIADSPAREFEANIFSDARVLRAPLPAVAAGALVEYEIKIRDRIPMLSAGTGHRIVVNSAAPFERFHAVIQTEPGVTLRLASRLIPEQAIRRETNKGGTRIELELGPSDPPKEQEGNLPFEESSFPYLTFSSGSSWQAVASAYAGIVNAKIGTGGTGLPLEAADQKGSPREIAMKLTAKLHKQIRYTGVEFGEAAIVPASPADTVSRGYGDCKDKATVLVAMLRAAGLKADVALLSSGFGPDVDGDTPGLGQFDHVIVYVEASPPLWIDATASEVRVGMLPPGDEGRLALIANTQTTSLVKTPESTMNENWQRNMIEMKMSELGPGEITAVMEGSGGWYEASARSTYGGDGKRAKQALENLVKAAFAAKSLGDYQVMAKDDFSAPYRMQVTAHKASIANTGSDDAAAALTPSAVFEFLPYGLTQVFSETGADSTKPRRHDFVFAFPFQSEYRYRIIPPVGFKLSSKLEPAESTLGPATFSRKYESNSDGTVDVIYRLDIAKRRWTPGEVEAFRAAYKKHKQQQPEVLIFLPETSEYVASGQMGKAISLLRDHLEQDRGSAMAHARYSRLLITAGLGGVGLAEAKESVRLDPSAAAAWATLGWAYQQDTFGRPMKGNWNYDQAETCLRKAVELDPTDYTGKMALAILLEYDRRGWRYAKDSRVDESIAIYRELTEKSPLPQSHQNLAVALLRTGQLDAAKEEFKKSAEQMQAFLLPLIQSLQEGAARGIASATSGLSDARQRGIALGGISYSLSMMRQYALAQTFMSAATRSMPELGTRAELLGKVKHWEDTILPENDPSWPVQHLLVEGMRGASIRETLSGLLSTRYHSDSWERAVPMVAHAVASIQKDLSGQGMDDEALLDYVSSLTAFEKTGDERHGYRIKSTMPGWRQFPAVYVVNEGGKHRIIGILPDGLDAVGDLVLALWDKKDLAGAQWWLDRVVADGEARSNGTGLPAVRGLWSGTTEALRGPAAIRLAAASLIGAGRSDTGSIQLLRAARLRAATALEREQLDKALCEALTRASKWDELMTTARLLILSKRFPEEGFRYFLKAAASSGKWGELEIEAKKRVAANPTNTFATSMVALAKSHLGDEAGAGIWTKKMLAEDSAGGTSELMLAGWMSVDSGKPNAEVLAKLKKAGYQDTTLTYTIAILEAALHQPDEAMQSLLRGIDRQDYDHLSAKAWLTYAAVCEEYGFAEEAAASRIRAKEAEEDAEDGPSFGGVGVRAVRVLRH